MGEFQVQGRQVYEPCEQLNWQPKRLFIVEYVQDGRAYVVDPFRGRVGFGHHMWVSLKSLHETGLTAAGKERKNGYKLRCAPTDQWQVLCGHCLFYVDRADLEEESGGAAGGLCKPCQASIEAQYATPKIVRV